MHFGPIDLDSLLIGYYGDYSVDLISGSSYWRIFIIHDDLCYIICNDFSIRFEHSLSKSRYTQVRFDRDSNSLGQSSVDAPSANFIGCKILWYHGVDGPPIRWTIMGTGPWALNAIKYTSVDTIYIFEHPTKISANGKTEKWLAWNEASETNENETIQETGRK